VVEHYPGYVWASACQESSLVLAHLYGRIPEIHMKRAWPMAQLEAFLGNALGGKSKGKSEMPEWKIIRPEERLPWFARPAGLGHDDLMEPHHCLLLIEALEAGELRQASWVLQLIESEDSLERIRSVAEQYREQAGEPENGG
jgi:hypothetical protein